MANILHSPLYAARFRSATGDPLDAAPQQWPALIDDATWRQVQEALSRRRDLASGRYLLTGFLRCPNCGRSLTGHHHRDGEDGYECSVPRDREHSPWCRWYAPTHLLERPVLAQVRGVLEAAALALEAQSGLGWREGWEPLPAPTELDAPRARVLSSFREAAARQSQRFAEATDRWVAGELDAYGYRSICCSTIATIQSLEARARQLRSIAPAVAPGSFADLAERVPPWRAQIDSGDLRQQREVLASLIGMVSATRLARATYQVEVTWTAQGQALSLLSEAWCTWRAELPLPSADRAHLMPVAETTGPSGSSTRSA